VAFAILDVNDLPMTCHDGHRMGANGWG